MSYGARFASRRGSGEGHALISSASPSILNSDSISQAQSLLARFGKPAAVAALFAKASSSVIPSPPGPPSDPPPLNTVSNAVMDGTYPSSVDRAERSEESAKRFQAVRLTAVRFTDAYASYHSAIWDN